MPTIKDVAALAGVSVGTASRALNNRGYLSAAVKKKVAKAMETLNYYPNDLARSLHSQSSHIIGLIVPAVNHPFFAAIARHIEDFAYAHGYKVLLCNSLRDAAKEREYITMLRRSQVDGIIMGSHSLDTADYEGADLRVISLDRELSPRIPYVCCDNYQGGRLAARHLIDAGCRNLVHISGSLAVPMLSNLRTDAFIDTCKEAGVAWHHYELPDTAVSDFQEEVVIWNILDEHPEVDGVFCTSDIIAAVVLDVAAKMKRPIPDDLKVVGFDGSSIANYTRPRLTTICQPVETICRYAVDHLVKLTQGEQVPSKTILPVTLRIGGSTDRE